MMADEIVIVGLKVIADKCQTTEKTIRRWVRKRGFPASQIDGTWRAVPEDVKQWFSEQAKMPVKGSN
jgi:hypothetical protein